MQAGSEPELKFRFDNQHNVNNFTAFANVLTSKSFPILYICVLDKTYILQNKFI